MKAGGATLFRQTFLVLMGALLLSHLASFLALILLPPGGSSATMLSSIASQLADPSCETVDSSLARTRRLNLMRTSEPPSVPAGMFSDAPLRSQLAEVLGVSESSVRLAWIEGREIYINRPSEVLIDNQTGHVQETVFLGELLFAREWKDYWCTGEVLPPQWYNRWQVRITLILLLSLAVLLSLAWLFARRLSRPIH